MTPDTDYRKADSHTNVEFSQATHQRLTRCQRDSESVAAVIDRALDAYEREQAMPDAVRADLKAQWEPDWDAPEGSTTFRLWNSTHERLRDCDAGDTFDETIAAAVAALERAPALPDAVAEVCDD